MKLTEFARNQSKDSKQVEKQRRKAEQSGGSQL